jgi:lipase maturation factor 1
MFGYSPPVSGHGVPARAAVVIAVILTLPVSVVSFASALGARPAPSAVINALARAVAPFHIANRYGWFAVMTTTRDEIVVEGSDDGVEWLPYEFKYKPGGVDRRPPWVAPHQPRLDWQMWFAALGGDDSEPWFRRFLDRLREGSPDVVRLLARDPFEGRPPRQIRAQLLRYHFSNDGRAWWTTQPVGLFSAPRPSSAGRP